MRTLGLLVAISVVSGCVSSTLFIESYPPGAQVRDLHTGEIVGYTPGAIELTAENFSATYQDHTGCYRMRGLLAQWPSGATAKTDSVLRLCDGSMADYTATFHRDMSAPGYEQDAAHGRQVRQQILLERQAAAAEQAANAAAWGAAIRAMESERGVNCTTIGLADDIATTQCK